VWRQDTVTDRDIATIVSRWTGIPLDKMLEGENDKLLRMDSLLQQRVIGQEDAIAVLGDAIRRSRAGLGDPKRPIGCFLFLGPTGVGKTEVCKALAEFLFDDERALLRIDMSEYMEKHAVSRLLGAPPGYVGYEEGGVLTDVVRRRPYQVVLLDEVEKAHPDVFNIFLQIFDDGHVTDSQGHTVNFRNTLIILTSNLGSQWMGPDARRGTPAWQQAETAVMGSVKEVFRPEFINRLDDIVLFNPLGPESMASIVRVQQSIVQERLKAKGIKVEFSEEAVQWLAQEGYDAVYGARPLKRAIQKHVLDPLSVYILQGRLGQGVCVHVGATDLGIEFQWKTDSADSSAR
jgi:ATP-dependent Clp protease ATP-binding subunit ClpB